MSKDVYRYYAQFKVSHYNFDYTKDIVEHLERFGFAIEVIGEPAIKDFNNQTSYVLSTSDVGTHIFLKFGKGLVRARFFASYRDTHINLSFYLMQGETDYSLVFGFNAPPSWKKVFKSIGSDAVQDNARYARLLLDVVEPFMIRDFALALPGMVSELERTEPMPSIAAALRSFTSPQGFVEHMVSNLFLTTSYVSYVLDDDMLPSMKEIKTYLVKKLESQSRVELYIKKDTYPMKLVLECENNHKRVHLIPLEPLKTKTIDKVTTLDGAFYVRLLIDACEHYPIHELKTYFA